jgi:hypothetical protein
MIFWRIIFLGCKNECTSYEVKCVKVENIDGKKPVVIEIVDEGTGMRTFGLVQEFEAINDQKVAVKVKPLVQREFQVDAKSHVIEAIFEGDTIQFIRETNIVKLTETIKKFESSKDEVLLMSENKTIGLSKKEFNEMLESILHKVIARKDLKRPKKKFKDDYVA